MMTGEMCRVTRAENQGHRFWDTSKFKVMAEKEPEKKNEME